MFKMSQSEFFEVGSIFAVFSLAFYTLIPYILNLNLIFIPFHFYKLVSGLFLIATMFFYINSPLIHPSINYPH